MKIFYIILLLSIAIQGKSQNLKVSLESIANYVGKTVTICDSVKGTFQSKGEHKNVFLNFGKPYPNQTFVVVIFGKDLTNFSYNPLEALKDKMICVTGKVVMYNDKPEIIVDKADQITIQ